MSSHHENNCAWHPWLLAVKQHDSCYIGVPCLYRQKCGDEEHDDEDANDEPNNHGALQMHLINVHIASRGHWPAKVGGGIVAGTYSPGTNSVNKKKTCILSRKLGRNADR
jgi:hypothetical protein